MIEYTLYSSRSQPPLHNRYNRFYHSPFQAGRHTKPHCVPVGRWWGRGFLLKGYPSLVSARWFGYPYHSARILEYSCFAIPIDDALDTFEGSHIIIDWLPTLDRGVVIEVVEVGPLVSHFDFVDVFHMVNLTPLSLDVKGGVIPRSTGPYHSGGRAPTRPHPSTRSPYCSSPSSTP